MEEGLWLCVFAVTVVSLFFLYLVINIKIFYLLSSSLFPFMINSFQFAFR